MSFSIVSLRALIQYLYVHLFNLHLQTVSSSPSLRTLFLPQPPPLQAGKTSQMSLIYNSEQVWGHLSLWMFGPETTDILFCFLVGEKISNSLLKLLFYCRQRSRTGLMFYNICGGLTLITWSWNIWNIKLNNWAACEADDAVFEKSGISHVQCLIPVRLIMKFNFWWRHGLSPVLDFYQFNLFDLFLNESPQPKASGPLEIHWSSASALQQAVDCGFEQWCISASFWNTHQRIVSGSASQQRRGFFFPSGKEWFGSKIQSLHSYKLVFYCSAHVVEVRISLSYKKKSCIQNL